MHSEHQADSLQALRDIRGIMERSSRFLSLSGWSGVWAGSTALVAAAVAWRMVLQYREQYAAGDYHVVQRTGMFRDPLILQFLALALLTFLVALAGGFYFTWRKVRLQGQPLWNRASRQMVLQIAIPMLAGGIFCLAFLAHGTVEFIVPACLTFYGLALVNGSKYTLDDIRYLGMLEIGLGCAAFFFPRYGIGFMAAGFGVLHILYGIIMWNKYDKQPATR